MKLRGSAEIFLCEIRAELPASVEKSGGQGSWTNVVFKSAAAPARLQTILGFRQHIALHTLRVRPEIRPEGKVCNCAAALCPSGLTGSCGETFSFMASAAGR